LIDKERIFKQLNRFGIVWPSIRHILTTNSPLFDHSGTTH
jgi:hypothetical protein